MKPDIIHIILDIAWIVYAIYIGWSLANVCKTIIKRRRKNKELWKEMQVRVQERRGYYREETQEEKKVREERSRLYDERMAKIKDRYPNSDLNLWQHMMIDDEMRKQAFDSLDEADVVDFIPNNQKKIDNV